MGASRNYLLQIEQRGAGAGTPLTGRLENNAARSRQAVKLFRHHLHTRFCSSYLSLARAEILLIKHQVFDLLQRERLRSVKIVIIDRLQTGHVGYLPF